MVHDNLRRVAEPAEPGQAGAGQDDAVELAGAHLADAGVDVAADRDDVEAEAEAEQLGGAPR